MRILLVEDEWSGRQQSCRKRPGRRRPDSGQNRRPRRRAGLPVLPKSFLRHRFLFPQKIFPQKANPQKVSHAGIILFCNYPQQSGDCFRRKLYPYGGNRFRGSGGRLNRYTSPIPRCLHRGIGLLRQLPNGHASMSAWVVACRNINRTVVVLFGLCQKIRRLFL